MTTNHADPELAQRAQWLSMLRGLLEAAPTELPTPPTPPAPPPYVPIGHSLARLGLPPILKDIDLDGQQTACLCIPIHELVHREWLHLTGGITNESR